VNAEPRTVRRAVVGLAVVAALSTAACGAGQVAETADEKPTLDGTNADIGKIALRGLALEAPSGTSFSANSDPGIKVVLVNTGSKADQLVKVSSPVATTWANYASREDSYSGAGDATSPVSIGPGQRTSYGTPEATGVLELKRTTKVIYPGTNVAITFTFATAGSVTVQVPVAQSSDPGSSVIPSPSGGDEG
jgi:hypothetical protein